MALNWRGPLVAGGLGLACILLVAGSGLAATTSTFTYDALGRLISTAQNQGGPGSYSASYAYDAASNRSNVSVAASGQGWPAVRGWQDFEGDKRSDLAWRDVNGPVQTWRTQGPDGNQFSVSYNGQVSADWRIVGSFDMNGDGRSDFLWRQTAGALVVWLGNGSGFQDGWSNSSTGNEWNVAALLDFNGDGKSDILWRHQSGALSLWQSNGTAFSNPFNYNALGNDWKVVASGDYNGDGKADLLWRHSAGAIVVWAATSTGFNTNGVYYNDQVQNDWQVVGMGDWNGDGKDDIFWQHQNGSVAVWQSNGSGYPGGTWGGSTDPVWKIQNIGDLNGDGKADLVFRRTSGACEYAAWVSTGSSYYGVGAWGMGCSWTLVRQPREAF